MSTVHIDIQTSHEGRVILKFHGQSIPRKIGDLATGASICTLLRFMLQMPGLTCIRSHGWGHILLSLPILLSRKEDVQAAMDGSSLPMSSYPLQLSRTLQDLSVQTRPDEQQHAFVLQKAMQDARLG